MSRDSCLSRRTKGGLIPPTPTPTPHTHTEQATGSLTNRLVCMAFTFIQHSPVLNRFSYCLGSHIPTQGVTLGKALDLSGLSTSQVVVKTKGGAGKEGEKKPQKPPLSSLKKRSDKKAINLATRCPGSASARIV